eukprot:4823590-Pyramimonas_sp.AAC.1
MRTTTWRAGIGVARLHAMRGAVDSCRERRAWEKPGNIVVPSVSPHGKFNGEVECDLMFCQQ